VCSRLVTTDAAAVLIRSCLNSLIPIAIGATDGSIRSAVELDADADDDDDDDDYLMRDEDPDASHSRVPSLSHSLAHSLTH